MLGLLFQKRKGKSFHYFNLIINELSQFPSQKSIYGIYLEDTVPYIAAKVVIIPN